MQNEIKRVISEIDKISEKKPLKVISHNDTDGITSAAIFSRVLQRWNKKFTLEIVKNLDKEYIDSLGEDNALIFLDLGSGSLNYLKEKNTEVFILDHHELIQEIPKNVRMINPLLFDNENCSAAAVCYLFGKEISDQNKDLANLAIIGMVGDSFDSEINKTYQPIIEDAEIVKKRGPLLYPATRPLDRILEYSSGIYIPGVTGSFRGVIELLREAGIQKGPQGYKCICDLNDQEMSNLITAILLRKKGDKKAGDIIGNIWLTKFFNKLEDAREISALINACSRMGYPDAALGLCLGNRSEKRNSERIYAKYKKSISTALKYVTESEKIIGHNYTIINAKDNIKDTIIGTVTSIISYSPLYEEGTVIIGMAYDENNRLKVSARLSGKNGRNVRDVLAKAVEPLDAEVGGHPQAAGCLISKEDEEKFIENLKSQLEIEVVKIQDGKKQNV